VPILKVGTEGGTVNSLNACKSLIGTPRFELIVVDLGEQENPFMLHIFAAVAQDERRKISERTKVALAAAKARGTKLGMTGRPKGEIRQLSVRGAAASAQAAVERLKALEWSIRAALADGISLRKAA
jgi:DNA invertase Pin-like site-specific DNA recombinase